MALNLVQHRGDSNVWERGSGRGSYDHERWLAAILAGGLLVIGLRRRSAAGLMVAAGAAALGWWAAAGADERHTRRARIRAVWPPSQGENDPVLEASKESFPASDAPSWTSTTSTTGNTGPATPSSRTGR